MQTDVTRRGILRAALAGGAASLIAAPRIGRSAAAAPQRTMIVMCDGFGLEYYDRSSMPTLKAWATNGIFARAQAVMPTVTNCNNASICCGAWPSVHGVIGNSYFDPETGTEEYMEDSRLLLRSDDFRAGAQARRALRPSEFQEENHKPLNRGADILVSAETPDPDRERRLGKAPPIYSREINYWLFQAALDILRNQPEIGLIYIHPTDYPMHMWPPEAAESREHLSRLDELFAELAAVALDAAILVTADHGMNFKSRGWDLEKALQERGAPVRIAISAERDRYLRHHQGMGGTAWVHLRGAQDEALVSSLLGQLDGIERVLTRAQAAKEFNLMESRIGDIVVIGDQDTVFGNLDSARETLGSDFRTHGSLHELNVPVVLHNARAAPSSDYFKHNFDLARWMYPV
jgi:phosphonoacetate hydrolase